LELQIMLHSTLIGLFLFILTTAIHTGGMVLAIGKFRTLKKTRDTRHRHSRFYMVGVVANSMFLVAMAEISVWALAYLATGAIEGVEKALYFSAVTFTTLGYGDIVLSERWRLLAGFEAANGVIMFGWTTALVFAVVQSLYSDKAQ
jgi:hypothetical protein